MALVGIFWFHGTDILAKCCNFSSGIPHESGLISSPYDHQQVWLEISKTVGLSHKDHRYLERGNITYDGRNRRALVRLEKAIATPVYQSIIRQRFLLKSEAISWLSDFVHTTAVK